MPIHKGCDVKKLLAILAALAATTVGIVIPMAASAVDLPLCPGWYANPDEQGRVPTQAPDGMTFDQSDLIHHAVTGLSVTALTAGTYQASPEPDQPSFFSVEVGEPGTYAGYATLRWNPALAKWTMVTGGQAYENASPADLVAMVTPAKSSNVLSFGVGYTLNPPGTVSTKVTSVTFQNTTYNTYCAPPTQSSSSAPTSASGSATTSTTSTSAATASASAGVSASASIGASVSQTPLPVAVSGGSGRLPTTGVKLIRIGALGLALTALGAGLAWVARRRRVRFEQ